MTYPPHLREKARELRQEMDLTIDEIAERLAIGRTTVYHWVSDLDRPLKCRDQGPPPAALGTHAMQAKYRRLREQAYQQGERQLAAFAAEEGFIDFVALFIAEGYKRNRNLVSISNSDPAVISIADHWIRRLSSRPITYSLQYHADQNLRATRAFWGKHLGVDPREIKLQRKSNSNQLRRRTWRSKHGVLAVTTHDTYFRARLQAWVDWLRQRWLDSNRIGA